MALNPSPEFCLKLTWYRYLLKADHVPGDTWGEASFGPRSIIWTNLVEATRWCYISNIKALGLVVSEEKIFSCFPYISHCKTCDPWGRPFLAPGTLFEQNWQRFTGWCYIPNIKARGLVISNKKIFSCFVCLFDLILYIPSTIFQLNRDRSSWVEPVLS